MTRFTGAVAEVVSEGAGRQRANVALPATPEYVRAARAFVLQVLGEGHPCAGTAVQLASELVTNSVKHSKSGHGGSVGLLVQMSPYGARVEVRDAGAGTIPVILDVSPLGEGGRGLRLVAAMSDDWGHWENEDGLTTWFEVRCA